MSSGFFKGLIHNSAGENNHELSKKKKIVFLWNKAETAD